MDVPPSIIKKPGIIPVAASRDDFQSSLGCGVCLKITGSGKPAAADLDGAPPVEGTLSGIVVDQDDSLNQGNVFEFVSLREILFAHALTALLELKNVAGDHSPALHPILTMIPQTK